MCSVRPEEAMKLLKSYGLLAHSPSPLSVSAIDVSSDPGTSDCSQDTCIFGVIAIDMLVAAMRHSVLRHPMRAVRELCSHGSVVLLMQVAWAALAT